MAWFSWGEIKLDNIINGGLIMEKRTLIIADNGKVLTNGTVYGTEIFLADGESADSYREISREEYEAIEESEAIE